MDRGIRTADTTADRAPVIPPTGLPVSEALALAATRRLTQTERQLQIAVRECTGYRQRMEVAITRCGFLESKLASTSTIASTGVHVWE